MRNLSGTSHELRRESVGHQNQRHIQGFSQRLVQGRDESQPETAPRMRESSESPRMYAREGHQAYQRTDSGRVMHIQTEMIDEGENEDHKSKNNEGTQANLSHHMGRDYT